MEMRTIHQAVIRTALSFLQDFPVSLGLLSTAWLWERPASDAYSRREPVLEPVHVSREMGPQPPAAHAPLHAPPLPPRSAPGLNRPFCPGLGQQCSPPHSGQLSKGSCLGRWEGLLAPTWPTSPALGPSPHCALSCSICFTKQTLAGTAGEGSNIFPGKEGAIWPRWDWLSGC